MSQTFYISAEPKNHSGPRLYFTGRKFSDHGRRVRFATLDKAREAARWLREHFTILRDYQLRITGYQGLRSFGAWVMNPIGLLTLIEGGSSAKTLLTRQKKRRRNPSDPYPFHRPKPRTDDYFSHNAKVEKAGALLKKFSGHAPSEVLRVPHEPIKEGLVIGTLDGVPYTTVRDGKTEHYIHEFDKRARPLLIASSDGRRLGIVGGRFQFTEAGIVDDKSR